LADELLYICEAAERRGMRSPAVIATVTHLAATLAWGWSRDHPQTWSWERDQHHAVEPFRTRLDTLQAHPEPLDEEDPHA
jgi:hypothetical protein